MGALNYVGAAPTNDPDIETKSETETILTTGVSRSYVQGKVGEQVALRASKVYVDNADSTYAVAAYYPAQDALLVPTTARGVANGVASLGSDSKIPSAQVPILGGAILQGPYGLSTAFGGVTTSPPMKVAQWNLGTGFQGQPLVWMNTSVLSDGGRPVLEIRIGTSTQTTYDAQTLIAIGYGKLNYKDYQLVTAQPCTAGLSAGQDGVQLGYSPATNLLVNAWVYDARGANLTTTATSITSAALYFARTSS